MSAKNKETKEKNIKRDATSKTRAAEKKSATSKVSALKKVLDKKVDTKKTNTVSKKAPSKKTSAKSKEIEEKSVIKNAKTSTRKTTRKSTKTAEKQVKPAEVIESYDLPYRYNETIVKILYQTPNTLFVYWDIADSDREKYIKEYGENFFNITRPVLIIHNDTMNYNFEIPINDFANSWYLHINDSKCNYRVELGRRPNYYNKEVEKEIQETIHTDYIYVSSSNQIESPNDHVLFSTNENNSVKFRNIHNNHEKSISLYELIKRFPAIQKVDNIPYISSELLKNIYAGIYKNEDISLFDRIKNNPSSGGNPSSGSLSSRFM